LIFPVFLDPIPVFTGQCPSEEDQKPHHRQKSKYGILKKNADHIQDDTDRANGFSKFIQAISSA
jgi:hypothetical protein